MATERAVILVIENDDAVREMVCTILSGDGMTALPASSSGEALACLRSAESRIDLVIANPEQRGDRFPDVVAGIQKIRPRLPVLVMSTMAPADGLDLPFIAKPFSVEALLAQVYGLVGIGRTRQTSGG